MNGRPNRETSKARKPRSGGGRRGDDRGGDDVGPLFAPKARPGPGPGPLARVDLKSERKNRHPWIYLKMCERRDGGPADGDAVAVYDRRRRFVGRGLFNSRSKIGVRILDFSAEGEGEDLNAAFFHQRIASAAHLRHAVLGLPYRTDAYRLVNSEGDGLSGLVVDVYGRAACCEVSSLGLWQRRDVLQAALREHVPLDQVVFKADERIQQLEGFTAPAADHPVETTITENGVLFEVELTGKHKTGFFCDQRENRQRLVPFVRERRVLDLCCCSGGFALYARKVGEAADVTGVDLDEVAIEQAKRNAVLNGLANPGEPLRFEHMNAFGFLKQNHAARARWDVVVLDPPKLVRGRGDLEKGLRDYYDLNRLAMRVIEPGGLLMTCSCSGIVSQERFLDVIAAAGFEADRRVRVLDVFGPGADHPVDPACPENRYLKVALLEVT